MEAFDSCLGFLFAWSHFSESWLYFDILIFLRSHPERGDILTLETLSMCIRILTEDGTKGYLEDLDTGHILENAGFFRIVIECISDRRHLYEDTERIEDERHPSMVTRDIGFDIMHECRDLIHDRVDGRECCLTILSDFP